MLLQCCVLLRYSRQKHLLTKRRPPWLRRIRFRWPAQSTENATLLRCKAVRPPTRWATRPACLPKHQSHILVYTDILTSRRDALARPAARVLLSRL